MNGENKKAAASIVSLVALTLSTAPTSEMLFKKQAEKSLTLPKKKDFKKQTEKFLNKTRLYAYSCWSCGCCCSCW